jgi:hypothetical protein
MLAVSWLLATLLTAPLIVSGQSNALALAPRLARYQPVIGYQLGAQPIAFWAPNADGWRRLSAAIQGRTDAVAFVWCQGEIDAQLGTLNYRHALSDLILRVRRITRMNLPVRLCELGPGADALNADLRAYVAADPLTRIVPTRDLPFQKDGIHPTDVGYDLLARRIRRSLD